MHLFEFYLKLGFEHISNFAGYDHMLFLIVLCAVYKIQQWKSILILVTAFTIGHSFTLILVSLDLFSISSRLIKFLIPLTIFITAFYNIISFKSFNNNLKMRRNYLVALFFGFIHGMDFSNYFKALIMDSSSIIVPLMGFNLGIEIGQLMIVFIIVSVAFIFLNVIGIKHREWNLFISGAAAGVSLISMLENKIW
tara:strand:- start:2243 stop:2827 length:585 start_codon:yes stop_codon:yes gene_type:complete